MIKRYMVFKNHKCIGYESSLDDAKLLISRDFNSKKDDEYEVKDLHNDMYVCVEAHVSSLKRVKRVVKRAGKPKRGRNDIIDDEYSVWLGKQPCVVTGATAKRGAGAHDMHCHHIHGRRPRNDYMQVPLIGFAHSWGALAYHNCTKDGYLRKWSAKLIGVVDIVEYFEEHARDLKQRYDEEVAK